MSVDQMLTRKMRENVNSGMKFNRQDEKQQDWTFHTPSFGDEEFEIPPINLQNHSMGVNNNTGGVYVGQPIPHPHHQQTVHHIGMVGPGAMSSVPPPTSPVGMMDGVSSPQYHGPRQQPHPGPHQNMYMSHISRGDSSSPLMSPNSLNMPIQQYDMHPSYVSPPLHAQSPMEQHPQMPMMQQQHHMQGMVLQSQSAPQQLPPHSVMGNHGSLLTTINQSQLSSQLGMSLRMHVSGHHGPGSVGSSPSCSNHTSPSQETSEDSDDSTPLSHLLGGIKRPSPEPPEAINGNKVMGKKPKVQKKKKKRDPNEPQKPVSAYALFFRDTQAAIKGQNPNASFGEVSKIVASMWDSLDAEHKNVYKKKTEAAKKEYLKALAAYRASLVSKAAADQSDSLYGNSVSSTSPIGAAVSPTLSSSPPGQPQSLSPLQKKSPLLTSLMEGTTLQPGTTMPGMNHAQPVVVASQVWTMHPVNATTAVVHHPNNQMVQAQQQIIQAGPPPHMVSSPQMGVPMGARPQSSPMSPPASQSVSASPTYSHSIMSGPPNHGSPHVPLHSNPGMAISQSMMAHSPTQTCLRSGCLNPVTDSPDWDREYCSSECVVSHCRDVFTAWVASRQASNSYASVK